jgi:hypothetical protein
MADWWTKGYPGGKMVGPPFIRPLYPPDAVTRGKTPSPAGADIEAVKRTVSRAGRWPWQAFDQAFSNPFSHGKSGNVSETGLAGVQRQLGIDSTGWMGEATYNGLRSIRIPAGLPHAGEAAMDATAIKLLESYVTEEADGSTLRLQALAKAKAFLGYTESPPGTNGNVFGEWYGMNFEPWCAMFVSYCFEHVGDSPSFVRGSRYSYCPYLLADARAGRYGLTLTGSPVPGDLVLYDWERNDEPDHIGFFEEWTGGRTFHAIEGNTAVGNNSNGGQVMRRIRDAAEPDYLVYFVRVAEP